MTDDQILATFVGLFEWAYQVQIPPQYRQGIEQHIRAGWFNQDPSEHTLVSFVLDLSTRLKAASNPDEHRANIHQHFANEFAVLTQIPANLLNDKYRILGVMHWVIESLRPGATGLPLPGQFQAPSGAAGARAAGAGVGAYQRDQTRQDAQEQQQAILRSQEEMIRKQNVQISLNAINNSRMDMIRNMARSGH